jgi:hypothetical protein
MLFLYDEKMCYHIFNNVYFIIPAHQCSSTMFYVHQNCFPTGGKTCIGNEPGYFILNGNAFYHCRFYSLSLVEKPTHRRVKAVNFLNIFLKSLHLFLRRMGLFNGHICNHFLAFFRISNRVINVIKD